jgi:hypothetical protein
LLTTDRRIRHQQNLGVGRIALVLLTGTTMGRLVLQHVDRITLPLHPRRLGQLRRGRDSVPGEVINLVRFTFGVGHATGRETL